MPQQATALVLDSLADAAVMRLAARITEEVGSCMKDIDTNPAFKHLHKDDRKDLAKVMRDKIIFRIRTVVGENHHVGHKVGRRK